MVGLSVFIELDIQAILPVLQLLQLFVIVSRGNTHNPLSKDVKITSNKGTRMKAMSMRRRTITMNTITGTK